MVFAVSGDPVGVGLVASLARPGGNITGLSNQSTDAVGKRLQLLREIVPGLHRLAILANPSGRQAMVEVSEVQAAVRTLGRRCYLREAPNRRRQFCSSCSRAGRMRKPAIETRSSSNWRLITTPRNSRTEHLKSL